MKKYLFKGIFLVLTFMLLIPLCRVSAEELTSLAVSFGDIVDGNQLVTTCTNELEGYTSRVVKWYKGGTEENPGTYVSGDATYESGFNYIVEVAFKPTAGNTISNNATYNAVNSLIGSDLILSRLPHFL